MPILLAWRGRRTATSPATPSSAPTPRPSPPGSSSRAAGRPRLGRGPALARLRRPGVPGRRRRPLGGDARPGRGQGEGLGRRGPRGPGQPLPARVPARRLVRLRPLDVQHAGHDPGPACPSGRAGRGLPDPPTGGRLALHAHNAWLDVRDSQGRAWLRAVARRKLLGRADESDRPMTYRGIVGMEVHLFTWRELSADLRAAGFRIDEVLPIDAVHARPIAAPGCSPGSGPGAGSSSRVDRDRVVRADRSSRTSRRWEGDSRRARPSPERRSPVRRTSARFPGRKTRTSRWGSSTSQPSFTRPRKAARIFRLSSPTVCPGEITSTTASGGKATSSRSTRLAGLGILSSRK